MTVHIILSDLPIVLPIKFDGCEKDEFLDTELMFPLDVGGNNSCMTVLILRFVQYVYMYHM